MGYQARIIYIHQQDSFVNYRPYHAVVCGYAKETTYVGQWIQYQISLEQTARSTLAEINPTGNQNGATSYTTESPATNNSQQQKSRKTQENMGNGEGATAFTDSRAWKTEANYTDF